MTQASAASHRLLQLARSRAPQDRERLLTGLAELCSAQTGCSDPICQALLRDVFMQLSAGAQPGTRSRLAATLASESWPPPELILALARDEIDVARPVIAASPMLTDDDLVDLVQRNTIDHRIEVARRPGLRPGVVQALLADSDGEILATLLGNTTAEISPAALTELVYRSQGQTALRSPLARHPHLTRALAETLHQWVGESLRASIVERFGPDLSTTALGAGVAGREGVSDRDAADRVEMEQRVVDKLQAAGELRVGLLVRALHDGRLALFKLALATLSGRPPRDVSAATDADRPDGLAQICEGAGLDRSAHPTVLALVRSLNAGRPGV